MTRSTLLALVLLGLVSCKPGFIEPSELARKGQGPQDCRKRCQELDMEMGALVLLGDSLPGCVCQPRKSASDANTSGASATGAGYVVIAAAAAAQQQHQQQLQAQQAARPR
ncbi:MAG: hypothetical protein EOO75_18735 [Myxococcales bacterium]|nr:MAG: hypothetical protein EOO75_18735 [Myxococcales bacterium]